MKFVFLTAVCVLGLVGCRGARNHDSLMLLPGVPPQTRIVSSDELVQVLESRWSVGRIEQRTEYSRTFETRGRQGVKLDEDDWRGQLHAGQTLFSGISYFAIVKDGMPMHFAVFARKGNKTWLIESGEIEELYRARLLKAGP